MAGEKFKGFRRLHVGCYYFIGAVLGIEVKTLGIGHRKIIYE